MPSSTTIGMPYVALVAAKNSPFSIDRKPITCGIALRRVIIIRKESITQAMAMPSAERVTVLASCEIGTARLNENTTSTMPISIVVGTLMSRSTSQLTFRRRISR